MDLNDRGGVLEQGREGVRETHQDILFEKKYVFYNKKKNIRIKM